MGNEVRLDIRELASNDDEKSIMIIKSGLLSFMGDMLKWSSTWGKKNGYDMFVRNTSDGMYELVGVKKVKK